VSRDRASAAPPGPADLDDLEARVLAWGEARKDVRAILILGSRARTDHPADEWADIDFAIAVKDPERYMRDRRWVAGIGQVAACYRDPNPGGATLHTLFVSGVHADFGFIPIGAVRQAVTFMPWVRRLAPVLDRLPGSIASGLEEQVQEGGAYLQSGSRTILDRDGVAGRFLALLSPPPHVTPPPSAHDFAETTGEFWFNAVWTAKHLRRGELWWATQEGWGAHLHPLLLRMIEWHARGGHGPGYGTWRDGRFLEEWADPAIAARIKGTYPDHDEDAAWKALFATMDLFRDLARNTASLLNFDYRSEADDAVTEQVTRLHAERG
jgi:aminoglycoside 6-adenylyltransferase